MLTRHFLLGLLLRFASAILIHFYILYGFTVSGEGVPLKTLKQVARKVKDDVRAMPGISQIELSGFPSEEIEIAVREDDLIAYNLTRLQHSR